MKHVIIVLTETHLDDSICESEIFPDCLNIRCLDEIELVTDDKAEES